VPDGNEIPPGGFLLVLRFLFTILPHRQKEVPAGGPEEGKPPALVLPEESRFAQVRADSSLRWNQSVVRFDEQHGRRESSFARLRPRAVFL